MSGPRAGLRPTNDVFQWLGDRVGRRVVEPGRPAWRDVVEILRARPDLVAINSEVRQKPLEAG